MSITIQSHCHTLKRPLALTLLTIALAGCSVGPSKLDAKKLLEETLRTLARKERISKHNSKAVKNMNKNC